MPRNLEPLFAQETAKAAQNQLFHLIEVQYPYIDASDQGGVLFLVDSNYDVTFGGQLYAKFPIKVNGATVNTDGSIDQASLAVANVSREIMYYVEKCQGLRNMRVKVKAVYANFLDFIYFPQPDGSVTTAVNPLANANAYIEDEYLIDNYQANESVVNFQLYPIIDLEIKLPRRRFMTDSCYWIYKDKTTCGYEGPLESCEKTLADCKRHGLTILGGNEGTAIAYVENSSSMVFIEGAPFLDSYYGRNGGQFAAFGTGYPVKTSYVADQYLVVLLAVPFLGPTGQTSDFDFISGGNERRFGAFPGVSGSRRIIL